MNFIKPGDCYKEKSDRHKKSVLNNQNAFFIFLKIEITLQQRALSI